jgi:hypothetical protein
MAEAAVVAALVRKRAKLAGGIEHARAELEAMVAGLAVLDVTLRLSDPEIQVEMIRPLPCGPRREGAPLGMRARNLLDVLRAAGRPTTAREIASRLLEAKGSGRDDALLCRATETAAASLRRQRARGVVACETGPGRCVLWRLSGRDQAACRCQWPQKPGLLACPSAATPASSHCARLCMRRWSSRQPISPA